MAPPPRSLQGKVAAVTGGARGIGRAIAARLVGRGMKVAIGDVDEAAAQATAGELGCAPPQLWPVFPEEPLGLLQRSRAQQRFGLELPCPRTDSSCHGIKSGMRKHPQCRERAAPVALDRG